MALINLRLGNLKEDNKYWREEKDRRCKFYNIGKDNLRHYIGECKVTKGWFRNLGNSEAEKMKRLRDVDENMSGEKMETVIKLWKEKQKLRKGR